MDNQQSGEKTPENLTPAPGQDQTQQDESAGQSPSAQPQAPQTEPPAAPGDDRTALIRYGRLNMFGEFRRPENITLSPGMKVIVRTERGIELGRVVLGYCEGQGDRGVSRQRWQEYLAGCGVTESISRNGQILRVATAQDLIDQRHLDESTGEKLSFCRGIISQMSLNMKPVAVEHLFGGERIIFYFKSEKRVDFRRLVRRLAKEYQTRIEMRQVGARDEARLLADYERCGRACCCRAFLKLLAPVNMKMAKVQKATLDPAKISGRCGRLMCCLRYENCTYDQLRKSLPPRNTVVQTPDGTGVVVDRQILTQLVVVRLADARRVAYPLSEITVQPRGSGQPAEDDIDSDADNGDDNNNSLDNDDSSDEENQSDRTGRNKRRRKNRRKSNG